MNEYALPALFEFLLKPSYLNLPLNLQVTRRVVGRSLNFLDTSPLYLFYTKESCNRDCNHY